MKNSYNFAQDLLNGGLIGFVTNKKTKVSKRYIIFISCLVFYLLLIGLCFFNGIGAFAENNIMFVILTILGIILTIDLYRFFKAVEDGLK